MTEDQARALFNEHREPGDLAHYGEKAAVAAIMEVADRYQMALEKAASRFNHCAQMIDTSFNITGMQRLERATKASHYAIETSAAAHD